MTGLPSPPVGVRRIRTMSWRTRLVALLVFVVLADFGADDGCSCNDAYQRAGVQTTITRIAP